VICPRCDSETAEKLVDSPVGKVWEVYICNKCGFSWRSTEDASITDPKRYDKRFKLNDEKIKNMLLIPPIPPLKDK
jgi:C4-type Zn-finger protein